MIIICLFCEKSFEAQKSAKYCSSICRQRAFYLRRYEKNPRYCIICNKKILYSSKQKYCSNECYKKSRKGYFKNIRKKGQNLLEKYKIDIGCALCGYNKCPNSLDFHHLYDKKFSIENEGMYSYLTFGNKRVEKELNKCILVCKNCHYEIHYLERKKFFVVKKDI